MVSLSLLVLLHMDGGEGVTSTISTVLLLVIPLDRIGNRHMCNVCISIMALYRGGRKARRLRRRVVRRYLFLSC